MHRIGGLLAVLTLLLTPTAARAATFTVNAFGDHAADLCDEECTLRDAVTGANADSTADTIVLPAGEYTLTQGVLAITTPMTITGPATTQPTATVNLTPTD